MPGALPACMYLMHREKGNIQMSQNSPINDKVLGLLLLLIIVVAALLGGLTNYWLGFGILFAFLPVVIFVAFRNSEQLTMALLGYVFLLTLGLVASLVPNWLLDSGMETNVIEALQVGWLIAIGVAIFVTAFILLLIVSAAAAGWHQDSRVSFAQAFKYVLLSLLGRRLFSLDVKEGTIQGADDEKEALEKYGGPGRLRVYPGQAVVLHKHGMTTRAVGPGTVMVSKREKVQTIVPLEIKVGVFEYENVLTRDRVPLTLKVAHGAQIETVAETQQRLLGMKGAPGHNRHIVQRLENIVNSGNWIGEPPNNFYVGVAEMIAKTPAEATKGKVEVALRDALMTYNLEDLFALASVTDSKITQDRLDDRRIAKIEKFIADDLQKRVKGDALSFKFVDINEIRFPEEITETLEKHAAALVQARTKIDVAESDVQAATYEAQALAIRARAKADARVIEGQSEGEARASLFKMLLEALKEGGDLQGEELVDATVELMERIISADSLEDFLNKTPIQSQGLTTSGLIKINGS